VSRASAGLLMFRRRGDAGSASIEVLLVHPGGPFWAKRDDGAWSLPKGELGPDEAPLTAAQREFREETGLVPAAPFVELGSVRQAGGKTVHAWAFAGDCDVASVRSNTFTLEWPPRSGRMQSFPEIDRAAWFPLDAARGKLVAGQRPLLDRLERALAP
jgi:predicted NUDIX family NTP pyrophosphohydrolase